jgi:hypothetical protein
MDTDSQLPDLCQLELNAMLGLEVFSQETTAAAAAAKVPSAAAPAAKLPSSVDPDELKWGVLIRRGHRGRNGRRELLDYACISWAKWQTKRRELGDRIRNRNITWAEKIEQFQAEMSTWFNTILKSHYSQFCQLKFEEMSNEQKSHLRKTVEIAVPCGIDQNFIAHFERLNMPLSVFLALHDKHLSATFYDKWRAIHPVHNFYTELTE